MNICGVSDGVHVHVSIPSHHKLARWNIFLLFYCVSNVNEASRRRRHDFCCDEKMLIRE